ncbi:MAG TPA: orotidine-5'-phosphate decarboxylase [Myxococcaceae bacterium]|nr:orotidine-5'-phosphate decarboxylase [Myxococcaceae bacterium]
MSSARDHLALALDVPLDEAEQLYERVRQYFAVAKVGLSLFVEHGPAAVERLQRLGARIFLDLKLHDIPNTVELAAKRAAEIGASFITVHAQGGAAMLRAARAGAEAGVTARTSKAPKVLAVTVLTSLSSADLEATGHHGSVASLAERLARLSVECGLAGVVCSPQEVAVLRGRLGPAAFLCTPGIRSSTAERGDQQRVATAELAVRSGADLLVVGRPVYAAADPLEAARVLASEVEAALRPPSMTSG